MKRFNQGPAHKDSQLGREAMRAELVMKQGLKV